MTLDTYLVEHLKERGLRLNEAREVVDIVRRAMPAMLDRWDDDVTAYPDAMLAVLDARVCRIAADY